MSRTHRHDQASIEWFSVVSIKSQVMLELAPGLCCLSAAFLPANVRLITNYKLIVRGASRTTKKFSFPTPSRLMDIYRAQRIEIDNRGLKIVMPRGTIRVSWRNRSRRSFGHMSSERTSDSSASP